jgi:hypothetical protein
VTLSLFLTIIFYISCILQLNFYLQMLAANGSCLIMQHARRWKSCKFDLMYYMYILTSHLIFVISVEKCCLVWSNKDSNVKVDITNFFHVHSVMMTKILG